MRIHILGICGTFMGGIALLAKEMGHEVSGSDAHVYPPMSEQLQQAGIELMEGYDPQHFSSGVDQIIIGNALSRGNAAVEYILNEGLKYTSGPQWLSENLLQNRWVVAVSGTHGKTTTASMLAWIMEYAGLQPGFLIGGVPLNFHCSARLGADPFFVIEADEYDTAFFDKRSKFVHYHARTLVMNNLEFDHADIFDDLAMIQRQFHHLLRTIPSEGLVVSPAHDEALNQVIKMGCWTPLEKLAVSELEAGWSLRAAKEDGSCFSVMLDGQVQGRVAWSLMGKHNMDNALAAIAAARHTGVPPAMACDALAQFHNVKRRMELRGEVNGIRVYDDFAHHPTAISTTLKGLKAAKNGQGRVIAVLEPRSNTMRMGVHANQLSRSLMAADLIFVYKPDDLQWDTRKLQAELTGKGKLFGSIEAIIQQLSEQARPNDHIVILSNGGFENIHQRLLDELKLK
ncbi:MAG: UDP-N-acetylmuramate:L-alanyl-gamma-D-glutamyl-meso-diaminopimelate ligase [gamma proteobacterium symbiont of Bathyaustriella thionipta]|nr:UDP-N-acetylmuramate:L-alanyl-gamma-D-glutamyl-meso-diaminopimelate ligase [gamma proteobacterium symbiont of Bathyaustriella thionipta]